MKKNKEIVIAAIQMEAEMGDVRRNLKIVEKLSTIAFKKGADLVLLPEFFSSATAFHPKMLSAISQFKGEPFKLLFKLSKKYNGIIGGSYLAYRNNNVYNSFVLVFPDGSYYVHDKDIPTMWENCYYVGGNDDGILKTPIGNIGVALCWELIRTQTVKRLKRKVDFVLSGSCWWGSPVISSNWKLINYNRALLRKTPVRFGKLLGVPVIHASHAGYFCGYRPPDEDKLQKRRFLGETKIINKNGEVLSRLKAEDGEGVIINKINIGDEPVIQEKIPDQYWIPDLPAPYLEAWEKQNFFGKKYYQEVTLPYMDNK